jgi:hypothetical protein
MIVILRPIKKNNWSGLVKYKNCYEDIGSYFTRSGQLYTGLVDDEATRLGESLGLDLRKSSEYWKTFFIRTTDKDLYLNTDDPMDELKYLFLRNHKRVKNSLLESKATANFVLINKEEEAKKASVYNRAKRNAIVEFGLLSPEDIRKALRIYGHNADSMTNEMAENRLFEIVEGDPEGFLNKWVKNKNRDTQYIIEQALSKNILRRNKRLLTYGTENLGYGMEEAIVFLDDPKNQDIKVAILKALDAKEYFDVTIPEDTPEAIVKEVKEAAAAKKVERSINQAQIDRGTQKKPATKAKVTKNNVSLEVDLDE